MSEPGQRHTLPADSTARPCRSCGFENPPGFRFCGACGASLTARSDVRLPVGEATAERRQLTVLFCDLVNSTYLANRLELEELRDVVRGYQAACAEGVHQYGGTISRFMGDGILVLFGYPHAHEDDAERAARAGLAMVEAVVRLPPPSAVAEPLAVRVGIATGVVVAGDLIGVGAAEEEAILGETVNLAGRLHAAAQPNTVVVASTTHALLGGRFLCEDLGAHRLKGFVDPVPCWRVVRPRSVASRYTAAVDVRRVPLVGREDDLTWLLGLWRSAEGHRGRAVMLTGEAGIGKSRIAETLCEHLGDACIPLRFQCSPHYTNRALHPMIQHIELAAGIGPEDPPAVKLEKLAAWLDPETGGLDELALLAALLSIPAAAAPALPTMTPQRQKQDTLELLLRKWRVRAIERPLLIIFEDLQWADPTTMEFLSVLVRRIDEMAVLAIFTSRLRFVGAVERAACDGVRAAAPAARAGTSPRREGRGGRADAESRARGGGAEGRRHPVVHRGADSRRSRSGRAGRWWSRSGGRARARAGGGHTQHPAGFPDGAARSARSGQVRGPDGQRHRTGVQLSPAQCDRAAACRAPPRGARGAGGFGARLRQGLRHRRGLRLQARPRPGGRLSDAPAQPAARTPHGDRTRAAGALPAAGARRARASRASLDPGRRDRARGRRVACRRRARP